MSKPQPIIEDYAQKQVRVYEETQAKLAAAEAMLASLTKAVMAHGPFGDDSRPAWWAAANAAIAQAKAAGIKAEG